METATFKEENDDETVKNARFVKEMIDDVLTEGVWVRIGKKGHHKAQDFSKTSVEKRAHVEDGTSVLSADQAQEKFDTLASTFKKQKAEVEKTALSSDDILDVIGKLGLAGPSASGSSSSKLPAAGNSSDDDSDADSDASSGMEDEAARILGKKPLKTGGGGSSSKGTPAKTSAAPSSGGKNSTPARLSIASIPSASPPPDERKQRASSVTSGGTGAAREVAALDGRTERLRKDVGDSINVLLSELEPLKSFVDGAVDKSEEARMKLQESMKQRNKQAVALLAKVSRNINGAQTIHPKCELVFLKRFARQNKRLSEKKDRMGVLDSCPGNPQRCSDA